MYYKPKAITKLERRFGKLGINNLMLILVGAMAIVFIMDMLVAVKTGQSLQSRLLFDRSAILEGEFWRVVTFLFLPPDSSIIFIVFALYFYYLIGAALENEWGAFGFTLYYLIGAAGAIVSGFIAGYATNFYLNMSLFLAFAILNPEFEVRLFFLIPIRMKWLAIADAVLLVLSLIGSSWGGKLSLLTALANLLLFFTPLVGMRIKQAYERWKWKRGFRK